MTNELRGKKRKKWMAICPRCEKFYMLAERRTDYRCACNMPELSVHPFNSGDIPKMPMMNYTECKIVETLCSVEE